MQKLFILVAILITAVVSMIFISCQDSALSEEEIQDIVQAEVQNQLADLNNTIATEVTAQIASLDELKLSELNIKNADGDIVARLGVYNNETGRLILLNSNGTKVVDLAVSPDGTGVLNLNDPMGEVDVELASNNYGGYGKFFNENGDNIIYLCSDETYQGGLLALFNSDGNLVMQSGSPYSDGALMILDKYGTSIFSAP